LSSAKLAAFPCKYCGKNFDDGRRLGGHVRQSHPQNSNQVPVAAIGDGEIAARVLELWKEGNQPLTIVSALRVHPRFVKEVLKEYDELLGEWKKFREA
jgi:hypothetical protein